MIANDGKEDDGGALTITNTTNKLLTVMGH